MENQSDYNMYCESQHLPAVKKMKSEMYYVEEYGESLKCPKLPQINADEDSLIDKMKNYWKKTDKKWILGGAAAGALALPALGFGALGPVDGGIAACKKLCVKSLYV